MYCFSLLAVVAASSFLLGHTSPVAPQQDTPCYDVVIVGGGPAGLSAASALGRVRDTALLIDSGVYRNGPTQEMHDVIGNDGTIPAAFRALARQQIKVYSTVKMMNGTVASITQENNGTSSSFRTTTADGKEYMSKKVILATGMKDMLPSTPGLSTGWGKGIYWCPWCDGWEHRDKPFAEMGKFSASFVKSSIAITSLNSNLIMLTNGTFTDAAKATASDLRPGWEKQLAAYNITINDRVITRFSRVHGNVSDYDDDFTVTFDDGESITRNAIHAHFPTEQASSLPSQLGLNITQDDVVVDENKETSMSGVFMVGDANSDNSTNVPHAMWSAKRAAVYLHGVLSEARTTTLLASGSKFDKRFLQDSESFETFHRNIGRDWRQCFKDMSKCM